MTTTATAGRIHYHRLSPARKGYAHTLRVLALLAVVCFSMVIVMSDWGEDREPFEFVPRSNESLTAYVIVEPWLTPSTSSTASGEDGTR